MPWPDNRGLLRQFWARHITVAYNRVATDGPEQERGESWSRLSASDTRPSRPPTSRGRPSTTPICSGSTVAEREKDRVFLATKIGQLAIQLNKGERERCVKLSFEIAPNSDFGELARELAKDGIKSELRNDSVPGIGAVLAFEDNKGTTVELFKDWSYLGKHTQVSGVGPLKLGHVAWVVNDVQATVDFYTPRARLPGVGLDRRFLRLHPLQRGSPHAQLHPRQERRRCTTWRSS